MGALRSVANMYTHLCKIIVQRLRNAENYKELICDFDARLISKYDALCLYKEQVILSKYKWCIHFV